MPEEDVPVEPVPLEGEPVLVEEPPPVPVLPRELLPLVADTPPVAVLLPRLELLDVPLLALAEVCVPVMLVDASVDVVWDAELVEPSLASSDDAPVVAPAVEAPWLRPMALDAREERELVNEADWRVVEPVASRPPSS